MRSSVCNGQLDGPSPEVRRSLACNSLELSRFKVNRVLGSPVRSSHVASKAHANVDVARAIHRACEVNVPLQRFVFLRSRPSTPVFGEVSEEGGPSLRLNIINIDRGRDRATDQTRDERRSIVTFKTSRDTTAELKSAASVY